MPQPFTPEIQSLTYDTDGVIRIGKTRVTLDTLIIAFNQGATAEEIAQQYPSLQLADIYEVIAFYLHQQEFFDNYLLQQKEKAECVRKENETLFPPNGIRKQLLARKITPLQ